MTLSNHTVISFFSSFLYIRHTSYLCSMWGRNVDNITAVRLNDARKLAAPRNCTKRCSRKVDTSGNDSLLRKHAHTGNGWHETYVYSTRAKVPTVTKLADPFLSVLGNFASFEYSFPIVWYITQVTTHHLLVTYEVQTDDIGNAICMRPSQY